jgi:hypothetical protein
LQKPHRRDADGNSPIPQTFTIKETLISEKSGSKQEYKRITIYTLTAKGEILNIISDDILPDGSSTPKNERHTEMIYIKI